MQKKRGITLIALVITIIVLLILAGVTIVTLTGDNGILTRTSQSKFVNELSQLQEELALFHAEQTTQSLGEYQENSLTAGKERLSYNTKSEEGGNIKTVLPSIPDKYLNRIEILKGELLFSSQEEKEIEWAKSLSIAVNPYQVENGVLESANENLLLVDQNGNITIPANVTEIGNGAFSNVSGLKNIVIPGNVKKIGNNAFSYNSYLETVMIEEGVEEIGTLAFAFCFNLKQVSIADSVNSIGTQGFYSDTSLEQIKLPANLKTLNNFVLASCHKVKEIILPEDLKTINNGAISGTFIEEIEIPRKVQAIAATAFSSCTNLKRIMVSPQNSNFSVEGGMLINNNSEQLIVVLPSAVNNSELIIPEKVKTINLTLVNNLGEIDKLKLHKGIKKIETDTISIAIKKIEIDPMNPYYMNTEQLICNKEQTEVVWCFANTKTIVVPEGIKTLKMGSFMPCKDLENLTLPESLEKIEGQVFNGLDKLTNIHLKKNVKNMDGLAFYKTGIATINIDEDNPYFMVEDNIIYNKEKTKMLIIGARNMGTFEIPNGVVELGDLLFHNRNVKEIKIPTSVKKIGNSFNYCTSLTKIVIPSNVEEINSNCFSFCNNLTEIIIQKPKDSIQGAPWNCPLGMRSVIWQE